MNIKRIIGLASMALLPVAASAATFIIPAGGTGAGANDSHWQTELIVYNSSASTVAFDVRLHDSHGAGDAKQFVIGPHQTVPFHDVFKNNFQLTSASGALEVIVSDDQANALAITSRTINTSPIGEFGQSIPATRSTDALTTGNHVVLLGPSTDGYRLNVGVYALTNTTVRWESRNLDTGAVNATVFVDYLAGVQMQSAVADLFAGSSPAYVPGTAIHATIVSGSAIVYGSSINDATGDPSFVPALLVHDAAQVTLIGVDRNQDGVADVTDANGDGVLDAPIDIFTNVGFPSYFRILAQGSDNSAVTYQLIDADRDVVQIDANGTFAWAPNALLRGTTSSLKIRATDANGNSSVFTIPVSFR
jgi:hypothetical protein